MYDSGTDLRTVHAELELQDLKDRAFQHIVRSLTVDNVVHEAFSAFSAAFEDVRKVGLPPSQYQGPQSVVVCSVFVSDLHLHLRILDRTELHVRALARRAQGPAAQPRAAAPARAVPRVRRGCVFVFVFVQRFFFLFSFAHGFGLAPV